MGNILKPCPSCGGMGSELDYCDINRNNGFIGCLHCGYEVSVYGDIEAKPIDLWNKRVNSELDEANQLINDLRKLLACTDPECAAKEALIQIKRYKADKGV